MILKVLCSVLLAVAIVGNVAGHTYHTGSSCPSVTPQNDFQMNSVSGFNTHWINMWIILP